MTTTTPVAELVPVTEPLFSAAERAALSGFVARYSGQTCDAYLLDLRQYASWCRRRGPSARVAVDLLRGATFCGERLSAQIDR